MPKLRRADRPRHPASVKNAQTKKLYVKHAADSKLRTGVLDGRTRLAKAERRLIMALVYDLGREPTAMEAALFRSVARMDTLAGIARAEVERAGTFSSGAADALVKASRELLALAESDRFMSGTMKPDNGALIEAQRIALHELSTESLAALHWHRYQGAEPPAPAKAKPLLMLPPPKQRIRIRPVNRKATQAEPPKPAPAPVIVDPLSRQEKDKRARVAAAEGSSGGATGRWDAPWNMP